MSVKIRRFQKADHAAALRLWRNSEGIGLSEADSAAAIAAFLRRNPGLSFAAVDGRRLIGTILCGHDGRRGFIHHLAVARSHRREGLGRRLVARSLCGLRDAGIEKCHLFVFRNNQLARKFWLGTGGQERTTLRMFSFATDGAPLRNGAATACGRDDTC